MSYLSQSQLESDEVFAARVRAADTEQAETYVNDGRADIAACASAVLRNDANVGACFLRLAVASPGTGEKVDTGDGTVDQSLVTDGDLLAITQANFPTVAALYFNGGGQLLTGP